MVLVKRKQMHSATLCINTHIAKLHSLKLKIRNKRTKRKTDSLSLSSVSKSISLPPQHLCLIFQGDF